MQLDLQLCGSHVKAAGALAKAARDSLLLADGFNAITIISDRTALKIIFAINPPMKIVKRGFGLNVQTSPSRSRRQRRDRNGATYWRTLYYR
jgi:hypothetical protein